MPLPSPYTRGEKFSEGVDKGKRRINNTNQEVTIMRSSKAKWLGGLTAMVLIGVPVLAMAGTGDKNLPSSGRFQVLSSFQNLAVLDRNSGLVWEQAPDTTTLNWSAATSYCANKTVGGMAGWRLPLGVELKSVQDPSLPAPFVPAAVFIGVQSANYWSALPIDSFPVTDHSAVAWSVGFSVGGVFTNSKSVAGHVWWVREPMPESVY